MALNSVFAGPYSDFDFNALTSSQILPLTETSLLPLVSQMSEAPSTDLKQVSALFNACIAQIRSRPHESLEKIAEKWLKDARVEVMKKIQSAFTELSITAGEPAGLLPEWAVKPECSLDIFVDCPWNLLDSHGPVILAEFENLMKLCGFTAEVKRSTYSDSFWIEIYFPRECDVSSPHFTSLTKCFDTLPKFSAAVLRITEGVEEYVNFEHSTSASPVMAVGKVPAAKRKRKRKSKKKSARKS
ncbi:hypothetical protein H0H92_005672 [Tricholoma furcatifolium]|nr:hypothetical protein H0H92_005672 [Tricholoma furcatifolium]